MPTPMARAEAGAIAARLKQRAGAQQDFQTVAALGFAGAGGLLDQDGREMLRRGLVRLAGRQPFVDEQPMPFCSDAVGILGVALGTQGLNEPEIDHKIATWMRKFLPRIYGLDGTETWQRCLFQAADKILSRAVGLPVAMLEHSEDVYIALMPKGIVLQATEHAAENAELVALKQILHESASELSYERAALRAAALMHIVRSAPIAVPGRIDSEGLVHLLSRVPAGLRKWTWENKSRTGSSSVRRWEVDHEYHVQNLLCLLLAPIFPDLDDEQFFKKVGQKSSRADFYVPSMRMVIEVKFIRRSDSMQKVIDEIAADSSLYRAASNDCSGVIAFIWDDSGRSQEHDYLRHGLRKLPGVVDVVIVSRPSNWAHAVGFKPRRGVSSRPKRRRS